MMSMVNHHATDFGGGPTFETVSMHGTSHGQAKWETHGLSNAELTGPKKGRPDKQYTLYAQKKKVALSSGKTVDMWAFNGQSPGPQLVVHEGDLVEIKLVNQDIDEGVTLHWHGVDVPNAEDGVAGMTQNAVMPGETYTYRFVVNESGTHWYHSHQMSSIQVQKGLFGPFIILPKNESKDDDALEMSIMAHDWGTPKDPIAALNYADTNQSRIVSPGTKVRLRLINSSSDSKLFSLHGAAYQVVAIDGNDIHEPGMLTDSLLNIGGGGRYDVLFTMPVTPVTLRLHQPETELGIIFSKDGLGKANMQETAGASVLDPTFYGTPAPSPFDSTTSYDREFTMILDQLYVGNYDGKTKQLWAINGEVFPHTPTFMVQEGDMVKTTIVNRSFAPHPIHLHGHHIHVLSKNGKPTSGSPLVVDTLLVEPGETYEVAFVANNPGLWMDHCHNLEHAALGMSMHLAYENVYSPFEIGDKSGNHPE